MGGGGGSVRQGAFIREEHLNQFYRRRGGVYYIRGVYLEVGIYEVIYGSQLVSAISLPGCAIHVPCKCAM